MADKLIIVMVNTDPSNPSELGAPFFQATVAATMEYEVDVILTGRSGELARAGVAEKIFLQEGQNRSVYDYMKDAFEAGVVFKVCTPMMDIWGDDLIPEVTGTVGSAYVISEAMADGTVTFTY